MRAQKAGTNKLIEARLRAHAAARAAGKSDDEAFAEAKAVARKQASGKAPTYRVVYGETMPAWEKTFQTLREAKVFAAKHESFGDVIFSIAKVVPGEPPQSLIEALKAPHNSYR